MATQHVGHESLRTIHIDFTFTGASGFGANGVALSIDKNPLPFVNTDEFIFDAFYRVTTTLTSGDAAGTYLEAGIKVDDADCILTSTTGVVNTLNSGAAGTKPAIAFTQATVDGRLIELVPGGTNDITGGTIEIVLVIARCQELREDTPERAFTSGNLG
jgi:hypothetical protein